MNHFKNWQDCYVDGKSNHRNANSEDMLGKINAICLT